MLRSKVGRKAFLRVVFKATSVRSYGSAHGHDQHDHGHGHHHHAPHVKKGPEVNPEWTAAQERLKKMNDKDVMAKVAEENAQFVKELEGRGDLMDHWKIMSSCTRENPDLIKSPEKLFEAYKKKAKAQGMNVDDKSLTKETAEMLSGAMSKFDSTIDSVKASVEKVEKVKEYNDKEDMSARDKELSKMEWSKMMDSVTEDDLNEKFQHAMHMMGGRPEFRDIATNYRNQEGKSLLDIMNEVPNPDKYKTEDDIRKEARDVFVNPDGPQANPFPDHRDIGRYNTVSDKEAFKSLTDQIKPLRGMPGFDAPWPHDGTDLNGRNEVDLAREWDSYFRNRDFLECIAEINTTEDKFDIKNQYLANSKGLAKDIRKAYHDQLSHWQSVRKPKLESMKFPPVLIDKLDKLYITRANVEEIELVTGLRYEFLAQAEIDRQLKNPVPADRRHHRWGFGHTFHTKKNGKEESLYERFMTPEKRANNLKRFRGVMGIINALHRTKRTGRTPIFDGKNTNEIMRTEDYAERLFPTCGFTPSEIDHLIRILQPTSDHIIKFVEELEELAKLPDAIDGKRTIVASRMRFLEEINRYPQDHPYRLRLLDLQMQNTRVRRALKMHTDFSWMEEATKLLAKVDKVDPKDIPAQAREVKDIVPDRDIYGLPSFLVPTLDASQNPTGAVLQLFQRYVEASTEEEHAQVKARLAELMADSFVCNKPVLMDVLGQIKSIIKHYEAEAKAKAEAFDKKDWARMTLPDMLLHGYQAGTAKLTESLAEGTISFNQYAAENRIWLSFLALFHMMKHPHYGPKLKTALTLMNLIANPNLSEHGMLVLVEPFIEEATDAEIALYDQVANSNHMATYLWQDRVIAATQPTTVYEADQPWTSPWTLADKGKGQAGLAEIEASNKYAKSFFDTLKENAEKRPLFKPEHIDFNSGQEMMIHKKMERLADWLAFDLRADWGIQAYSDFMKKYELSPGEETLIFAHSIPVPHHTYNELPIIKFYGEDPYSPEALDRPEIPDGPHHLDTPNVFHQRGVLFEKTSMDAEELAKPETERHRKQIDAYMQQPANASSLRAAIIDSTTGQMKKEVLDELRKGVVPEAFKGLQAKESEL